MGIIRKSRHTARRRHRDNCFACELPIDKGDSYLRFAYVDNNSIGSYCEHDWCDKCFEDKGGDWYDLVRSDELDQGYLAERINDDGLVTPEWRAEFCRRVAALAKEPGEEAAVYRAMLKDLADD
jgi:hypothetical protein